ncbi:hypothetical protein [Allosalinactinospora lopnorensis]|uniref:hypothetical protein n=1 Tax=Allosalinactinospora lopnorensis TaxID=1352348 RepID=UPI000623D9E5|nr:hypothetical protein [Allosalinactinospora lopnorensis]
MVFAVKLALEKAGISVGGGMGGSVGSGPLASAGSAEGWRFAAVVYAPANSAPQAATARTARGHFRAGPGPGPGGNSAPPGMKKSVTGEAFAIAAHLFFRCRPLW